MTEPSGQVLGDQLSVWKGCLVEGDLEQQKRQRKVRRRALVLSVGLQSMVLAAIVLVPLLGKPARIALANVTPMPPYRSRSATKQTATHEQDRRRQNTCRFCPGRAIPPNIAFHDPPPPDEGIGELTGDSGGTFAPPSPNLSSGPAPPATQVEVPHVVRLAHISPAMLTHRVEPVYPTLARQTGRAGRVELRAIIAADGTIQSLEAVGGDPLFYRSALEAVRQWRYTPTLLNGQQVQVDTFITVIYNLQR